MDFLKILLASLVAYALWFVIYLFIFNKLIVYIRFCFI